MDTPVVIAQGNVGGPPKPANAIPVIPKLSVPTQQVPASASTIAKQVIENQLLPMVHRLAIQNGIDISTDINAVDGILTIVVTYGK